MNQPLIFQHFRELQRSIPWCPLGDFPTPVEPLADLADRMNRDNLWIKRDDLSGQIYGGNKIRSLEFLIADAIATNTQLLVAYSALGSSWPLACVLYAKLHGLPTDVFFLPYPMDNIKQAQFEITKQQARATFRSQTKIGFAFQLYRHLRRQRKHYKIYLTPPGGVSPASTLGFVNAVLELKAQQEKGECPIPDTIFCPLGTGGTAVGISIGLDIIGWPTKLIAVRVVDFLFANRVTLKLLIHRTLSLLRSQGISVNPHRRWGDNLIIEHNYIGKGYSEPTGPGEAATQLLDKSAGQQLDSTYTAKACAAFLAASRQPHLQNKCIMFWQTLNSRELSTIDRKLVGAISSETSRRKPVK